MRKPLEKNEIRFEKVTNLKHKDHETRDTRVSEYLRKYGQGRIDTLPADTRPEVHDNRTVDEMLDDPDNVTNSLGTEPLDVMLEMQRKTADFEAAFADIEITAKEKELFDKAVAVLKDSNSSYELKCDAYRILDELEAKHKVTRVRK